jgi:hypothetical protein
MNNLTVATLLNPADAQLVRSRLEAAGFHPEVFHELSALSMEGYALSAGGIRVQVPEAEVVEARNFLEHSTPIEDSPDTPPDRS